MFAALRRVTFRSPPRGAVCAFHDVTGERLKETVLSGMEWICLGDFATIFASPLILWRMLRWIGFLDPGFILFSRKATFVRRLGGRLARIYWLACFDAAGVRAVVTIKDDSAIFQWLCHRYPRAAFFAIQNGVRTTIDLRLMVRNLTDPRPTIRMPKFFCFGEHDVRLYRDNGALVEEAIPVGSLLGCYYDRCLPHPRTKDFDICLVSQWIEGVDSDYYYDEWIRLLQFAARFVAESGKRLAVAMRGDGAEEFQFFQGYFADRATLSPRLSFFASYDLAYRSELTVSVHSTMMVELLGLGHKVLAFNLSGDEGLSVVPAGPWLFDRGGYGEFATRLLDLLAMSEAEFQAVLAGGGREVMAFPEDEPTHAAIRRRIMAAARPRDRAFDRGKGPVEMLKNARSSCPSREEPA